MAKKAKKKATKKAAKKSAKATAKKTTKKGASKKPAAKKPKKITTGKGATPAEIGNAVVAHVNAMGKDSDLWKKHFHKNFTSIEGTGDACTGVKAVAAKCEWWVNNHTVHSCKATGPFVGATGFSVHYEIDVESKDGSMPRMLMKEVGVYTVKNGKVVQEEFMYAPMG